MKRIKSFKLFESGLSHSYGQDIQISINDLLSEERFQPHIDQISHWNDEMRKFKVGVTANESKWGIQYDVIFGLDEPVDITLVNDEIKHSWREIMDIIMDKSKSTGQIKLTKFKYFGHSGAGKKDGHTKQIEDVTDELVDAIDENPTGYTGIIPIMLQFTITN